MPAPFWPIRWPPVDPLPLVPGTRSGRPALTILELIIAAAILVTAAGVAIPAYVRSRENGRILQAVTDIVAVDHDIAIDESTRGSPPPTLAAIGRGNLLDPWGRPYEYLLTAGAGVGHDRRDRLFKPLNTDYDLYSRGKDGQTQQKLDHPESLDDVVRALNGAYVGLASEF
jgi:general secretion pathway protein G